MYVKHVNVYATNQPTLRYHRSINAKDLWCVREDDLISKLFTAKPKKVFQTHNSKEVEISSKNIQQRRLPVCIILSAQLSSDIVVN